MKGVIVAGGEGSRLWPLTNPLGKCMLPVYNQPMIMHVIATLVRSGITDIMIVLDGRHPGLFLEMLEDGSALGCQITYRYRRLSEGPGRTLLLAKDWVDNENFVVILGDSLFFLPLSFTNMPVPHMFLMPLNGFDNPQNYAQVEITENHLVKRIVFKPLEVFSNLIETTCFILPPDAFERLQRLNPTAEGETLITPVLSQYVAESRMSCTVLPPESYIDCGSISALHKANAFIRNQVEKDN